MKPEPHLVEQMLITLSSQAHKQRQDAALFGEKHDGGADKLEAEIKAYRLGWQHIVPQAWQKTYDQVKKQYDRQNDPEYKLYLELKQKFDPDHA